MCDLHEVHISGRPQEFWQLDIEAYDPRLVLHCLLMSHKKDAMLKLVNL